METTILIFTYNRSNRLIKSADVLFRQAQKSPHKLNVVILDASSEKEHIDANKNIASKYNFLHIEDNSYFYIRLFNYLDNVNTETVIYMDDEDILIVDGIFSCVDFLENNPDYSLAYGDEYSCIIRDNGNAIRTFKHIQDGDKNSDNPISRMWTNSYYKRTWHMKHLFRTSDIKKIRRVYLENECNEDYIGEFFCEAGIAMAGKIKYIENAPFLINIDGYGMGRRDSVYEIVFKRAIDGLNSEELFIKIKQLLTSLWDILYGNSSNIEDAIEMIISYFVFSCAIQQLHWEPKTLELVGKYQFPLQDEAYYNKPYNKDFKVLLKYDVDDKKINTDSVYAIYGAGTLGEHFYNQLRDASKGNIKYFVDRNASKMKKFLDQSVVDPSSINASDFDYIIIANEVHKDLFKQNILNNGVPEDKIITINSTPKEIDYDTIIALILDMVI